MTIQELYNLAIKNKAADATIVTWNGLVLTEPEFKRFDGEKFVVLVPRRNKNENDA